MTELLLPVHDLLHDVLSERFCGWPALLGFCPEFWFGFMACWVFLKVDLQRFTKPGDNKSD